MNRMGRVPAPWEDRFIPDPNSGCFLWIGAADRNGYGLLKRSGQLLKAHRVAWERENGPIPEGMHVLHHCDNPPCVNPVHLFLGTHQDNMDDREAKGRNVVVRGEAHGSARLTAAAVRDIKRRLAIGELARVLATAYRVSVSAIRHIASGRCWRTT